MNLEQLFRQEILSVEAYGLVQEKGGVKLNQNESPFDIPQEIKEEVFKRLSVTPWNRYTQELPSKIAGQIAMQNNWPVEGIVLGAGSNLLLELLAFAITGKGKCVFAPSPCFSLYKLITNLSGAKFIEIPFQAGFEYNPQAWIEGIKLHDPDLLFLCTPNNPTGSSMGKEDIARIVQTARGITVIDEAYWEFAGENRRDILCEFPTTVLVRTFSKAYSGAGIRLGYLLADPSIAAELRKIVPPFNINVLTATVAEVLLERPDLIKRTIKTILSEKKRVMGELDKLQGFEVFPSKTNFFLLRTAFKAEDLSAKLAERDILVRVLKGEGLDNIIRVNIGTEEENNRFLKFITELL